MKKSIRLLSIIAAIALILLALPSCTHNNGDIGNFFGSWKLVSIQSSDLQPVEYQGDIFWDFQNSTISMIIINDRHDTTQTYGNWSADDDILTINFPDADYAPLTELNLPRTCSMRIEKQTSKEMILNYQASTEQNFIYTFRKW
jgi:hypothetical protein